MALFTKAKTPIIGVDLGSGFVKMAQFNKVGNNLKLVDFGFLGIPDGAIVEGKIERINDIKEVLQNLLTYHAFIGNRVATNVSGKLVMVRELVMDDLPPQELDEAIKWEVTNILPASIDTFSYDYQVIGKVEEGESEKLHVLFAAAPMEAVQTISELFKSLNLELVSIEVEAFSVLRLLRFLGEISKGGERLIAAINLGHNYTSINIVDRGLVRFSRTLPWGGKRLTDKIAYFYGISPEEAEKKKINELNLADRNSQIFQAIQDDIREITLEIKRSISFYFSKYNDGKVMDTVIILEGGTANAKNVDKLIEDETGYPTVVNRLFADIAQYDPNLFTKEYLLEMSPSFAIATGLALKEQQIQIKRKEKTKEKVRG